MVHYKLTYFNGRGLAEIIRQVTDSDFCGQFNGRIFAVNFANVAEALGLLYFLDYLINLHFSSSLSLDKTTRMCILHLKSGLNTRIVSVFLWQFISTTTTTTNWQRSDKRLDRLWLPSFTGLQRLSQRLLFRIWDQYKRRRSILVNLQGGAEVWFHPNCFQKQSEVFCTPTLCGKRNKKDFI